MNIRLPNITGKTADEQLAQIKSYLVQLVHQLNHGLTTGVGGAGSSISADSITELKTMVVRAVERMEGYYGEMGNRISGCISRYEFRKFEKSVNDQLAALPETYASKTELELRDQTIAKQISDLDNRFVSQVQYETDMGEINTRFGNLGQNYTSKAAFDQYKSEVTAEMESLEARIAALEKGE
jgi:hypothetical protein